MSYWNLTCFMVLLTVVVVVAAAVVLTVWQEQNLSKILRETFPVYHVSHCSPCYYKAQCWYNDSCHTYRCSTAKIWILEVEEQTRFVVTSMTEWERTIIIIIIIRHELGPDRPVSASSNILFKGLPSRLCPFALQFSTAAYLFHHPPQKCYRTLLSRG